VYNSKLTTTKKHRKDRRINQFREYQELDIPKTSREKKREVEKFKKLV